MIPCSGAVIGLDEKRLPGLGNGGIVEEEEARACFPLEELVLVVTLQLEATPVTGRMAGVAVLSSKRGPVPAFHHEGPALVVAHRVEATLMLLMKKGVMPASTTRARARRDP